MSVRPRHVRVGLVDEATRKLAARLRAVSIPRLVAELDSRGFDVVGAGGEPASVEAAGADIRIGHFPDHVLLAAARDRGLGVERRFRSGLDSPRRADEPTPSLLKSLEDTFTRNEMEDAYQEMLARRRRR